MIRSAAAMMALLVCGVTTAATINVPADYTTIQAAVDVASNGDEILVAPGTYTGTGDEVVSTDGKAITIKASGTPEETIIDGEGARRVLLCSSSEGADTIIEGFTITGGGNTSYGGGIFCSSSSPTLTGCTISGNTAGDGGGIYCSGSSPTINGCTISDNTAGHGGGIRCSGSSPTITGCTITNNTANYGYGGGISCNGSSPTITGCTISGNTGYWGGGGISCRENSSPTITDCTITDNTGYRGGGIYCSGGSPTITDCTISNNTAGDDAGGIYCSGGSSPTITDCTISGNTASYGGGMRCWYSSSPTLTDTVVCGNDPDQIYGSWHDNGGNTIAEICPWYQGACCIGQSCSVTTEANCSGDYLGDGTNCDGNPCYVPPTGACCINESCSVTTEAACSGDWLGEGGSCDDCTPDCPDVSGDGFVAVHDLLAVLEAWNSDDPDADVDGDGIVGMDDLAAVIDAWGPCE